MSIDSTKTLNWDITSIQKIEVFKNPRHSTQPSSWVTHLWDGLTIVSLKRKSSHLEVQICILFYIMPLLLNTVPPRFWTGLAASIDIVGIVNYLRFLCCTISCNVCRTSCCRSCINLDIGSTCQFTILPAICMTLSIVGVKIFQPFLQVLTFKLSAAGFDCFNGLHRAWIASMLSSMVPLMLRDSITNRQFWLLPLHTFCECCNYGASIFWLFFQPEKVWLIETHQVAAFGSSCYLNLMVYLFE